LTDQSTPPARPVRPVPTRRPTARSTRFRVGPEPSFLERNRRLILGAAAVLVLGVVGVVVAMNAAEPAYACAQQWTAPATATPGTSPAPDSTPRIGYVQPDLGKNHIPVGQTVRYPLCPPASGRHYNTTNLGPIKAQLYGPEDPTIPQGWVHNLEHGGLVVLYRCPGPGCEDAGQAAFRQFYQSFPASPICKLPVGSVGPVITRFDQMAYPFAALLWGQVLPMESWDPALTLAFFNQQAERTNPEQACPRPTATPGPSTPAPSASGSPVATPTVSPAATTVSPAATSDSSPAATVSSPAAASPAAASPAASVASSPSPSPTAAPG
jgi:hypothetical protein